MFNTDTSINIDPYKEKRGIIMLLTPDVSFQSHNNHIQLRYTNKTIVTIL